MQKRSILATILACSFVVPAMAADTKADADEYSEFQAWLALERCTGDEAAIKRCEAEPNRATFVKTYLQAKHGDYRAQKQVATWISMGAYPVRQQSTMGCAWWLMVVNLPANPKSESDRQSMQAACRRLLPESQQQARIWASEMGNQVIAYPSLAAGRRRPAYCRDYLDSTARPLGSGPVQPEPPRRQPPPECR